MRFAEFHDAIKSPDLKSVAEHWHEARAGQLLPGWKDLNPRRIAKQLPNVWAYTYNTENDAFTGRLSGDRIDAMFGRNFRGIPMSELYPSNDFPRLFDRCKRVITEPSLFHGDGMVFMYLGRPARGERIILPLADDGLRGDGVLGVTLYPTTRQEAANNLDFQEEAETWFNLVAG